MAGGIAIKDGKKRMEIAPIVQNGGNGKKRIEITPGAAGPSNCPQGCVSEDTCRKRVAAANAANGGVVPPVPTHAPGLEHYQDKLDEMERFYNQMGALDEDDDILFHKKGKLVKKKSVKQKPAKHVKQPVSGCGKYSKYPLKCIAKGCNYSKKTKTCTGTIAPSKIKPKRKRVVYDDDEEFAKPKQKSSPAVAYRHTREQAIAKGHLQFTIDGQTFVRKSLTAKRFSKK